MKRNLIFISIVIFHAFIVMLITANAQDINKTNSPAKNVRQEPVPVTWNTFVGRIR